MIKTAIKAVDNTMTAYREFHKYDIRFTMDDMEKAAIRLFYVYLYDEDPTNVLKVPTFGETIYILDNYQDEEKYVEYIRRALRAKSESSNWANRREE